VRLGAAFCGPIRLYRRRSTPGRQLRARDFAVAPWRMALSPRTANRRLATIALALFAAFANAGCNLDVSATPGSEPNPAITPVGLVVASVPSGAEARIADGSSCRTPCELMVRPMGPFTVEFNLKNYVSRSVEVILQAANPSDDPAGIRLDPNPLTVMLEPIPRSAPPPKAKPVARNPAPAKSSSADARTGSIH
jgi:PEGA domain